MPFPGIIAVRCNPGPLNGRFAPGSQILLYLLQSVATALLVWNKASHLP